MPQEVPAWLPRGRCASFPAASRHCDAPVVVGGRCDGLLGDSQGVGDDGAAAAGQDDVGGADGVEVDQLGHPGRARIEMACAGWQRGGEEGLKTGGVRARIEMACTEEAERKIEEQMEREG